MIGLLLRNKAVHNVNAGAHWSISLLFSLVQDLIPHYDVLCDRLDGMWQITCLSPARLTTIYSQSPQLQNSSRHTIPL
jgi:hypothetical protein